MVSPCTRAVAAILASSRSVSERPCIRREYSRKHAASIRKTCDVSSNCSAHHSISFACADRVSGSFRHLSEFPRRLPQRNNRDPDLSCEAKPTQRPAVSICAFPTRRRYRSDSGSIKRRRLARSAGAALWNWNIEPRTFAEQNVFPVPGVAGFRFLPFVDGDDYSSVHAAAGDDLRTFFDSVVYKFAETRFGVLQLPFGRGFRSHGAMI